MFLRRIKTLQIKKLLHGHLARKISNCTSYFPKVGILSAAQRKCYVRRILCTLVFYYRQNYTFGPLVYL